jgi:leucyl-tRNA synthetase
VRLYVFFAGPPERDFNWSDEQVEGAFRFLKRVWQIATIHEATKDVKHEGPYEGKALEIIKVAHKGVKRLTDAIERLSFNTAVAGAMEYVNALYAFKELSTDAEKAAMKQAIVLLAKLMAPLTPHISNEICEAYTGISIPVEEQVWPTFNPDYVVDDVVKYAVQILGKLRSEISVPLNATEAEVRAAAEADEKVAAALAGKPVKKFVFVPKRLVNFVI